MDFIKARGRSLSMVVLMLALILLIQSTISYTTSFGVLDRFIPTIAGSPLPAGWFFFRLALVGLVIVLWLLNRKQPLFMAIIAANALLTVGLLMNLTALGDILLGVSATAVRALLVDVVLMAVSNILIFSIWYWVIDPPGVVEDARDDEPWDFLFPQRGGDIPHYEDWQPRYTDYLYLSFTTSFAFSPTDTLPLTRRAKMLMLLQSAISLVTLTGIAGAAINVLASGA